MAKYRVTAPDGATYNVEGPEGATDEQVLAQVKAHTTASAKPPASATTPSATSQFEPAKEASGTEFTLSNINRGIAGMIGQPVEAMRNVMNLARDVGSQVMPGTRGLPEPIPPTIPGGPQWIEEKMRAAGMIKPGTEPETFGGRYAASMLQALPSALMGKPSLQQIPRSMTAAATSGFGAQAATDIGGPEWAPVGALLPGAGSMKTPSVSERATAARQAENFAAAKELGIPVPPRAMKVDKVQQKLVDAANKDLGQPPGAAIEPQTLQDYRKSHYDNYVSVIEEPALKGRILVRPGSKYPEAIKKIAAEERQLRENFPNSVRDVGLQNVLADFIKPSYPSKGAMEQVQRLRESATNNLSSASSTDDTRRLGLIQKRIADAMEGLIGENIAKIGKPELTEKWKTSRAAMAKSHNIEASLNPVTRKIDPLLLSVMQTEGVPLSGQLKKISSVAGEFPLAAKPPSESEEIFTKRVTPMAVTHPEAAGAHLFSRLGHPIAMSKPYQFLFVDPATKLTPEQQRAIRALIGGQAQNRQNDLPLPP